MFIVFEGLDGAGSSTHSELLAKRLEAEGKEVLLTREPTDKGPVGEMIRAALQHKYELTPEALQLLFVADRAEHLKNEVEPALAEGKIVICDRYIWSTIAYGSLAIDDRQWLVDLNQHFQKPDHLFYIKQDVDTCLERIAERDGESEFFEKKEKLEKIYEGYEKLAAQHPEAHVVETNAPKEEVAEQVWSLLY